MAFILGRHNVETVFMHQADQLKIDYEKLTNY